MSSTMPARPRRFRRITISVCVAGSFVAGIMGALAGDQYRPARPIPEESLLGFGFWWGGVTGLIAGIMWCCVMIPLATPNRREALNKIGALIGILVGVLSTALLHAGLMLHAGEHETWLLRIGICIAIPIGAVVGGISGGACRDALAAADGSNDSKTTYTAPPTAPPPRNPTDTSP
jgi:hypothetical protein